MVHALAVHLSSYGCTWEVKRALEKLEKHSASPCATHTIVDRANWLGNLTVSLLYVFVFYFFCSLALTLHKRRKVLICILATNQ